MTRLALTQGAYTARSIIADAQRAVNLYAEKNPPDALVPFTHYNAPGLVALGSSPGQPGRGLYMANSGDLYLVAGQSVYYVSPAWERTQIGIIGTASGIVSMADNGTTAVLVDGSPNGYQIDLTTRVISQITPATNSPPIGSGATYAFYGANRVDVLDGYILLNQPGTRNFYSTYLNEIVFDALYFAAKNGYSDNLVGVVVTRRTIWLIGERTTEIWFNAGAADFPFQIMPGPFIQHGSMVWSSIAQADGRIFWLAQDQAGKNVIARAEGYQARSISTPAMQVALDSYSTTTDAQGFCFQFGGHTFYQLNLPTADRSWRWDESTELWHECPYTDGDGVEHRHRVACAAYAYGLNVGADWETGQLYSIDPDAYTDAGAPMQFRRGFPHIMADGKRVIYPGFVLDVQAATSPDTTAAPDTGPLVWLRWSDDRGETWSNAIAQSLGATGQYLSQPQWNRLGMARDRVFEVYGTIPGKLAINGAFLDPAPIPMTS